MIYISVSDLKDFTLFHDRIKQSQYLIRSLAFDAVNYIQQGFTRQGLHKPNEWAPRMNPNLAGIFSDANQPGGQIKTRRLESRPVLMDTGTLKKSISSQILNETKAFIGTNVEYAEVQNEGGYSTQIRTNDYDFEKKIDKFIKVNMSTAPDFHVKQVESLKNRDAFVSRVRQRKFIGYDKKRGIKVIEREILGTS